MYHLTVNARQHHNHTAIGVTLDDVGDNDRREQIRLSSDFIPQAAGGLFDLEPIEFLDVVIESLIATRRVWQDTHQ